MNCEKCQAPAVASAAFCRQCGARLPAPSLTGAEPRLSETALNDCRECGVQLRPGAKFCASCGAVQAGTTESTAAAPAPDRGAAPASASASASAPAPAPAPAPKLLIPSFPGRLLGGSRRSIALMVGLAVIVVGIVAAALGAGGGGPTSSLSNTSRPDSGAQPSPPPPPAPAGPDTDTTITGDAGDDPAPARAFTSADGYVVVPPEGWIRDSDSKSKGTFTESRWHLPGAPGVYVLVNHTAGYAGSAEDGASGVRAAAQRAEDYEEIGWRELAPSGWYWEFNLAGARKIDVFTKGCGDGYAALGAAPTGQFETHRDTIEAFIESLALPCGDSMPSISGSGDMTGEPGTETTPATQTTPDTPDTETTPATPTHTVTPEAARNSPTRILRRHFQQLSSGDYDAAYGLLSSGYRDSNPSWTQQPSEAEPLINVVEVGPSRISGGQARVPITFYARDRNATRRSDTKCRRFSGDAKLVKEGSVWRYDPTSNPYDVTVVDSASPECNP
jgi:hypothetical protein